LSSTKEREDPAKRRPQNRLSCSSIDVLFARFSALEKKKIHTQAWQKILVSVFIGQHRSYTVMFVARVLPVIGSSLWQLGWWICAFSRVLIFFAKIRFTVKK